MWQLQIMKIEKNSDVTHSYGKSLDSYYPLLKCPMHKRILHMKFIELNSRLLWQPLWRLFGNAKQSFVVTERETAVQYTQRKEMVHLILLGKLPWNVCRFTLCQWIAHVNWSIWAQTKAISLQNNIYHIK